MLTIHIYIDDFGYIVIDDAGPHGAFESHTDAMIHFKHIESCQFNEDAKDIVTERMRGTHSCRSDIKINTYLAMSS